MKHLLLSLDPTDGEVQKARDCVALACDRMMRNEAKAGNGHHPVAATPAAVLAEAADKIRRATTSASVKRVAVGAAARICGAKSTVWWDRQTGSSFISSAHHGAKPPPEVRAINLAGSFWKASALPIEGAVTLSLKVEDHHRLLAAVNAANGVMVRAGVAGRPVGVLGVFSGRYDEGRLELLTALAQHAAAASCALTLCMQQRQRTAAQQRSVSEIGFALSSALSLDELLDLVCRSAVELVSADGAVVYLAGQHNKLELRAASNEELIISLGTGLDGFAQDLGTQPFGRPLWQASSRGIGPGYRSILGLALSVRGDQIGALILLCRRPRAFTPAQREIISSFAAQAAVAIENLQLVEDMQRRLLEMADLTWMSTRITSTMDLPRIAATVADAVAKALDVPRTALFVVNKAGEYEPITDGPPGTEGKSPQPLPSSGHLGYEVLSTGVTRVVSDARREELAGDALVHWLGVRSLVCVPMVAQQGMRGILVVGSEQPREFPPHAVPLLSAYANQTALALQSAILYQDVVRHLGRFEKLFGVSQTLASSLDLTQTLDRVLEAAAELLDAPVGTLMLMDSDTEELIIRAARGVREDHEFYRPLKLGEGLAGKAAQSESVLVSADLSRDGRSTLREHAREGGLQAAIAAPLITRGQMVGVLNLYRRSALAFSEDDQRLVTALANSAAVAIENARLYEETQERAQFLGAMMSEINHRVRNTLQAVAGLLRMEMDQQPPRSIKEVLSRGIARLQSVAVVHDMLQARDLRFVDIKQAARRIIQLTTQSALPGSDIETKVSGARVMLPSQQATNVAMVLSELVDNSARHGLPGVADAWILVNLAEVGGDVLIEVKDNGIGLPAGFDIERDSRLGLQVVRGLVEEELGGSLDIQGDKGLTVRARFPKHL